MHTSSAHIFSLKISKDTTNNVISNLNFLHCLHLLCHRRVIATNQHQGQCLVRIFDIIRQRLYYGHKCYHILLRLDRCKESVVVSLLPLKQQEWSSFSCCVVGAGFHQIHVGFYIIIVHHLKQAALSPSIKKYYQSFIIVDT